MEEKEINLGKYIKFSIMVGYKKFNQYILGITANKENQYLASNSLYKDIAFKTTKWEFNIWLILISFHITIYGKNKKIKE
ncbi:hypothetical protein [Clostridium sp. CTA-6]